MKELLRKLIPKKSPKNSREILLARRRTAPGAESTLLVESPELEKMSQVILDFVQPWLKEVTDHEDARWLLGFAIIAWNLSLLSESECEAKFEELLLPKLPRPQQITFRKMVTRRRTSFANKRRLIIDYQIGTDGKNLRLDVVTSFEE